MCVLVPHCLRCALWLVVAVCGLASSAQAQDLVFADGFEPSTGTGTAPNIAFPPTNVSVQAGATATFSVVATGTGPFTYQWRKNGTAISGATNAATYTTPATVLADNGARFSVVVGNASGNSPSSNATLFVSSGLARPIIVTAPRSLTLSAGQPASFTVVATGSAPLTYRWFVLGSNTPIAGATGATYSIASVPATPDTVLYEVEVMNAAGTSPRSAVFGYSVSPPGGTQTLITSQPQGVTVDEGDVGNFTAFARGTAPLSYQWRKNGVDIPGATTFNYTTPPTTAADNNAEFTVRVGNALNIVTSAGAMLTVSPAGSSCTLPPVGLPGDVIEFGGLPAGFTPQYITVGPLPNLDLFITLSGGTPGSGRIVRMNRCGEVRQEYPLTVTPRRIAVGPDNRLYFTSEQAFVGRLDPANATVQTFATSAPTEGLAFGADSRLYFTLSAVDRIGNLDLFTSQILEQSVTGGWRPIDIAPYSGRSDFILALDSPGRAARWPNGFAIGSAGLNTTGVGVITSIQNPGNLNQWQAQSLSSDGAVWAESTGSFTIDTLRPGFPGSIARRQTHYAAVTFPAQNMVRLAGFLGNPPGVTRPMPTPNSQPFGLVEHPDGQFIWITLRGTRTIARLTP